MLCGLPFSKTIQCCNRRGITQQGQDCHEQRIITNRLPYTSVKQGRKGPLGTATRAIEPR